MELLHVRREVERSLDSTVDGAVTRKVDTIMAGLQLAVAESQV